MWDDKTRAEANIRANKAGGSFDFDTLANEFELEDLLEWGFDKKELDLDLWEGEPTDDPGAQIDKADELRQKWGVELDQLWQLGEHQLICGDCTDKAVVERIGSFDLMLTDPPYGINVVSNLTGSDGAGKPVTIGSIQARRKDTFGGVKAIGSIDATNWVDAGIYVPVVGDDKPFDPSYLLSFDCEFVIFGGNYFSSKLPNSRCWIVWDKNNTGNFADAELAWTSFKTGVRLYKFTWNWLVREGNRVIEGKKRVHPTQKPVGLFEKILNDFSEEGQTVADFYLGSGTTLIACERLGRKCRAIEISPAYVAVALQRWADMTGKTPVLLDKSGC
jgi:16S rRNA G966 N2-methylase RsmD